MGFDIDIRKVNIGGETFEHFMFRAAEALRKYIEQEYYTLREQYMPKVYQRSRHSVPWKDAKSYHFEGSLFAEDFVEVGFNRRTLSIKLRYDANAYHESVVRTNGRYGQEGYLPILLNYGWTWDGWEGYDDFFHGFEGMYFIESGIQRFEKDPRFQKKGITVKVTSLFVGNDGRAYTYDRDRYRR